MMHDGMQYDPVKVKVTSPWKSVNSAIFERYLLPDL